MTSPPVIAGEIAVSRILCEFAVNKSEQDSILFRFFHTERVVCLFDDIHIPLLDSGDGGCFPSIDVEKNRSAVYKVQRILDRDGVTVLFEGIFQPGITHLKQVSDKLCGDKYGHDKYLGSPTAGTSYELSFHVAIFSNDLLF